MRIRPSSRLIVLSPENHVLLFRFCHQSDALSGKTYWATPGGGVEAKESFEQTALRELTEETGLIRGSSGPQIASRTFAMQLPSGENVLADERFFIIHALKTDIDRSGWSDNEKDVIHDHHWWSIEELRNTQDTVYPLELLIAVLTAVLSGLPIIEPPKPR